MRPRCSNAWVPTWSCSLFCHAGKGRGIVATSDIRPGDLLLVAEPLGKVLRGPEGAPLRPEHLIASLDGQLTPEDM